MVNFVFQISYLTLTLTYISNWEFKTRVIFTTEFEEDRKTGENIRKEVFRQLKLFGILEEDIPKITFITDQAKNMTSAFEDLKKFDCTCHILNTILRNTFDTKFLQKEAKEIDDSLKNIKSLVKYFKQTGLVHKLDHKLYQSNDTRWNTILAMLESFLYQIIKITEILQSINEEYLLDDIDISLVEDLVFFLKVNFFHLSKWKKQNFLT